jgi:hypothetical protein
VKTIMDELDPLLDDETGEDLEDQRCPFCGARAFFYVAEVFADDRAFTAESCCESMYDEYLRELEDLPREEWVAWFERTAGVKVRSVAGSSVGQFTLDYGLELGSVSCADAKAFVVAHHRHNPPPVSWRWGHAVRNGRDLVGVAMVGRPVARKLDHTRIVEVNRLCVPHTDPKELAWNACSMLYGAAAREAKARGFAKIITYTLESEDGTTLRAAGWIPEASVKGRSWDRTKRARTDKAPTVNKVRWAKVLDPKSPAGRYVGDLVPVALRGRRLKVLNPKIAKES